MLRQIIELNGWSEEQWLAASILAFIVLAVLVVLHRISKIVRLARRNRSHRYEPNLRPLQRRRRLR